MKHNDDQEMGIMDLERLSRTIKTRGIEFPREAMEEIGIKKIFNSVGTLDSGGGMDYGFDLGRNYEAGNCVLIEKCIRARVGKEPLVIVSAIIFYTHVQMMLFALDNYDVYGNSEVMSQILN